MLMGRRTFLIVAVLLFGIICLNSTAYAADSADVTGTWESTYSFGPVKEVMTAEIQQMGENLLGSFSVVQSPSGDRYSGIIFGTVSENKLKVYYMSVQDQEGADPLATITFTESVLIDKDTQRGEYYYRDGNQISLSGSYEAYRI
jgi:hypothetical protein